MRCKRCGIELDLEDIERCPACAFVFNPPVTDENLPTPAWKEQPALEPGVPAVAAGTDNKRRQGNFLTGDISAKMVLAIVASLGLLGSLVWGGLYLMSWYEVSKKNKQAAANVKTRPPALDALDLVQIQPSTSASMSIKQRAEQLARDEQGTEFDWWSGMEKEDKKNKVKDEFLVIFSFKKSGKKEKEQAVWAVNIRTRTVKAQNQLAQTISK